MGTLYLCLKISEKMQKTRNQSDHPGQRKLPKTEPLKKFAVGWLVDTSVNKVFCFGPRLELSCPKLNNNLAIAIGGLMSQPPNQDPLSDREIAVFHIPYPYSYKNTGKLQCFYLFLMSKY